MFLDATTVWVKRVPVLAPTGEYGTQNNLSLWNFVQKEAFFKSSFDRNNLVWSLSPSRTTVLEPLFRKMGGSGDPTKALSLSSLLTFNISVVLGWRTRNGLTHHLSVSLHILLFRQRLQSGASALSGCSRTSVAPRIQLVSPPAR